MEKQEFTFTLSDGTSAHAVETEVDGEFVIEMQKPDRTTDSFTWARPGSGANELEVDNERLEAIAELSKIVGGDDKT